MGIRNLTAREGSKRVEKHVAGLGSDRPNIHSMQPQDKSEKVERRLAQFVMPYDVKRPIHEIERAIYLVTGWGYEVISVNADKKNIYVNFEPRNEVA